MTKPKEPITFPKNDDLKGLIRFEEETGNIWLDQQRMILIHASAFGSMRAELIESFGEEYARGVLMRMGYAAAESDAQLAKRLRSDAPLEEMFCAGPQLHALEGVVSVEPVKLEIDTNRQHFYGEFLWENSFETSEHLRLYDISEQAVCWNLLGYATGYTTALLGQTILFKEVDCVGKGDAKCRIIGKPVHEWDDHEQMLSIFKPAPLAERLHSLEEEVEFLRNEFKENTQPGRIIAESPAMKEVMYLLNKAAETDVTVLMLGETGVGKEVFSQAIHQMGKRSDKNFIAVNCAALPRDLVESELFGVEKGAYTGAEKSRPGRFERANGGTLFLDELGELGERAQAKLLRAIQTGEFERVGGTEKINVDVRLIAATNADLAKRVKDGRFRADLYYRLNIFPITIPPLKERKSDIPGLILKFINKHNQTYGRHVHSITDDTLQRFMSYDWPGNIRELENVLERGVILAEDHGQIESTHVCLGMPIPENPYMVIGPKGQLENQSTNDTVDTLLAQMQNNGTNFETLEKEILAKAIQNADGNVLEAARYLGMTGPQCRYRLKKAGLV